MAQAGVVPDAGEAAAAAMNERVLLELGRLQIQPGAHPPPSPSYSHSVKYTE